MLVSHDQANTLACGTPEMNLHLHINTINVLLPRKCAIWLWIYLVVFKFLKKFYIHEGVNRKLAGMKK